MANQSPPDKATPTANVAGNRVSDVDIVAALADIKDQLTRLEGIVVTRADASAAMAMTMTQRMAQRPERGQVLCLLQQVSQEAG